MTSRPFRYNHGKMFFTEGIPVFINLHKEKSESHLHAHNFIEISYVLEGKGVHVLGDKEYPVTRGDLFIINFDTPHEFLSLNPDQPIKVYNCLFRPEFIDSTLEGANDFIEITYHLLFRVFFHQHQEDEDYRREIKIIGKDYLEIREIFEKMHREFLLKEQGFLEMLRSKVVELLITIFRIYRKNSNQYKSEDNYHRAVVGKLTEYIKNNPSAALNLEELSLLTFLSRTYLCRIFKEETGMTLTEYQQKVRMQEACRMLAKTDSKVYDIMLQVGYSDTKHFNNVFKKVTGATPGAYRKNNR